MKKSSLLVTLPALALAGLLLSGCSMFRSTKAWETAKQESPLEIPPGMDTPPATAALVIPPSGAGQTQAAPVPGEISDAFVVSGDVDSTYQKVGQQLAATGSAGQVTSHDDASHSYMVNVVGGEAVAKKRGFFGRMFHHDKSASDTATHAVQVTVNPSGGSASEVRVRGDEGAVAKLIDALKKGMGS
ncbi:hypothetical protein [Rhodanobacter sp. DHG33]|uniref:hypothetical protein n=1 Tax=Rhodanobacter sp. DHG33 TaxID=2775921 RepID=UPI00178527C3|nr:hypothetical protein [Rhodanobacter sp. DHG33]MBD8898017.1 hypothetical protein [Rhodanobacter sp. DHG33]